MSTNVATLIFGIGLILAIFGSLIGGYLSSRFGDSTFLCIACFVLAFSVSSMAYVPLIGLMIVFFLIYRLFRSSIWPASTSLVSALTAEQRRGTVYSILYFVPGILGSISPMIGSTIIEGFGILSIFPFALILFLLSFVIVLLIRHQR